MQLASMERGEKSRCISCRSRVTFLSHRPIVYFWALLFFSQSTHLSDRIAFQPFNDAGFHISTTVQAGLYVTYNNFIGILDGTVHQGGQNLN